jgi:GTP diphosphokinase / guanosine-3',5'-bis(diphosphate) 3'-diphosphatase
LNDLILLTRAWNFAATRHVHQRRKAEAQAPYVNHLAEVAALVVEGIGGQDANLIAAAVLHDSNEDTETTRAELVKHFSEDIAELVTEVTDDKGLPKHRRKELQVEQASNKRARAKTIKLADKTSNLGSHLRSPPRDWSVQWRREYPEWAMRVAEGLRGVNPVIEWLFGEAADQLRH